MSGRTGPERDLVIGVDVGTGSARAGVFDLHGRMIASDSHPIQLFRPAADHVEQSSDDIWNAVGQAVRGALGKGELPAERIGAISFDATCSLVALGADDEPITLSTTGDPRQNVIVWMDHRAEAEAEEINRTGHRVLAYVGGTLSPEQEPPKLRWIKTHLPRSWRAAAKFLDLADFLVYRATGRDVRSLCTVVCKWTYLGHEGEHGSWDQSFFQQIGLDDLFLGGRAGEAVRPMGTRAGELGDQPASELGLVPGTTVGVGMIDAHAGGIGSVGMTIPGEVPDEAQIEHILCLIAGTSSCHLAVSREARFVPGIWGPYYGAMVPGFWLSEGGQSATGALIDHLIDSHAATPALRADADREGVSVYELLNRKVSELKATAGGRPITDDLHILPDFLGNRSPRADSQLRGMISGLSLDASRTGLALLYHATVQAIAYGTRHILDAMEEEGYRLDRIHATGGGAKNPLWLQEHADITGRPIRVAAEVDAVMLGTAMLAAVAAGAYASIPAAITGMSARAEAIEPGLSTRRFHDAKYAVFHQMYRDQQEYRRLMIAGAPAIQPDPGSRVEARRE